MERKQKETAAIMERRRRKAVQKMLKTYGPAKTAVGCGRDYARAIDIIDLEQEYYLLRGRSLRPVARQTEVNTRDGTKFDVFLVRNLRTQQVRKLYFRVLSSFAIEPVTVPKVPAAVHHKVFGDAETTAMLQTMGGTKAAESHGLANLEAVQTSGAFWQPSDKDVVVLARQDEFTPSRMTSDDSKRVCETCLAVETASHRKEKKEFRLCGRCKLVYYCGTDCQRYDWKDGHASHCVVRSI